MHFTTPFNLILLLAVPFIAWLGWPTRGFARRLEVASLAVRMVIVLCLVLSLSGLEIARAASDLAVVFLIDASDSMSDAAKAAATNFTRQAIAAMGPDDQAAVIVFAGDALVERSMSTGRALDAMTSIPFSSQTDLGEAIQLALALYPPGAARRLVILSDAAETTGDMFGAAQLAAATGVEIVAVPFFVQPGAEATVTGIDVPPRLRQGERFDVNVSMRATQPTRAGIRVMAGGEVAYQGTVDLNRGSQSISIPLTAGEPGFVDFLVQIDPERDRHYQNNELAAFSRVVGPPKVLVVTLPEDPSFAAGGRPRPDEHSRLVDALEAASFVVDIARPGELPPQLSALAEYASVVLVDVPARELGPRQLSALQSYVRDLGGGLVAIGGPTSFGVGGYYRTPLEVALPVEMSIDDQQRRPSLAMVFVIDHSGSMADLSDGVSKLDLAKEAAARSVELLFPTDRVGVVIFDDSASWVTPLTDLSDPDGVIRAIGGIRAGGGTDILAGLQAMARELPNDPAGVKHVILLTDGGANPAGIPELVRRLHDENGITLTAVGVGRDAAPFLPQLAQIGGGRYHFAADAGAIPTIFTEETTLASRAYVVEEAFFPKQVNQSPILSGIAEAPRLHGYVATTAKDAAQTILISAQRDPILAAWQHGLGRAVAFTSDATGRWARDWIGWEGFPTFWAQAIRYTVGDPVPSNLNVQVDQGGEEARLIVDARSEQGDFLNGLTLQANIVGPDGRVEALEAGQVAPGRYQASFQPRAPGAYLIGVSAQSASGDNFTETAGWVQSYSPEYRELESDPDSLYRLTIAVNGRVASDNPAEVFAHSLSAPGAARPVWPWLLALAALLLPMDIAMRRLTLSRADLQRAWARAMGAFRVRQRATGQGVQRSERMATLLGAKERTHPSDGPAEAADSRVAKIGTFVSPEDTAKPEAASEAGLQPASVEDKAVSTTAALLARKRSKRQKRG